VKTIIHGLALLEPGCELAKGYCIARPISAANIPDALLTGSLIIL
jgi:EAL domain-containing protein (putative c-di-GMP-specific phosphodiesterase class I)